ncbi:ankyrin repeat domain-containing protein 6-like, partial [Stegodyphus dumicola]|uniref:ankyrin repeat domain-containing protein 6-like n=1 Tax=Stegodyphus dumicola TaxID=202533 RepID=UPI0015AD7A94
MVTGRTVFGVSVIAKASIAKSCGNDFSPHYDLWNMNFKDSLGNALLHLAASISDTELIKLLLEKGADITNINKDGRTPVRVACEKTSLKTVKLLTERSPDYILEEFDNDKGTPLDIACRSSCPEVVKYLLSQGTSVHKSQAFGLPCPLSEAVSNKAEYAIPIASLHLDAGVN